MLHTKKSVLAVATGSLLTATLAFSPLVSADSSPFASTELSGGYTQLAEKDSEGKCGEAKCGESKCGSEMKDNEGKCGEAKCGAETDDHSSKNKEASCGGLFHQRVFLKKV